MLAVRLIVDQASNCLKKRDKYVILILKSNATDDQIDHVLERVEAMGLQHHLSRGTFRTIVGIIGDEEKLRQEPMRLVLSSAFGVLPQ